MRWFLFVLFLFQSTSGYKFLAHSTLYMRSPANFNSRISDILIDAGHEVVVLAPILDSTIRSSLNTKARIIEVPQCSKSREYESFVVSEGVEGVWTDTDPIRLLYDWSGIMDTFLAACNSTIHHPGLIEQLKAEKFDAAFTEPSLDYCGPGLFHLLGIEKWAVISSLAIIDGDFMFTQVPTNPAYVPTCAGGQAGDVMSFTERLANTATLLANNLFMHPYLEKYSEIFRKIDSTIPETKELMALNSLVFTNSEPLIDFPRPSAARILDIGGITTSQGHGKLNETWSNLLNLRKRTVFISFGTLAKAYAMPDEYKKTIVRVAKSMPEVTFIWKYEKPEHRISEGVENLVETTWAPQPDLLRDPRVSLFITHCGQGSISEAVAAGVPLLAIPIAYDQLRNGRLVERNGIGIMLEKKSLASEETLREAILELLNNEEYRNRAKALKEMIDDRPFSMKDILVRNLEFLAAHGPLRRLDHYGRKLNILQYYLLDIMSVVFLLLLVTALLIICVLKKISRLIGKLFKGKAKKE